MARGQQQDIAGFRRSHKRIPTKQAMLDDQQELQAKQKAVSSMGQGGAAQASGQAPRKPLSSYQNQMNPIGSGSGQAPPLPNQEAQSRNGAVGRMRRGTVQKYDKFGNPIWSGNDEDIRVGTAGTDESTWSKRGVDMTVEEKAEWMKGQTPVEEESVGGGIREDLQTMFDNQYDPALAEERVARQRAAQEATVRATMGAGEAGRSGAAALLAGEAGRLAEGQAREAELARELGIAELGSALMNFDLAKERYDDAEKRQAASAAMWLAQGMDVSYDEAFELLGLPDNAKSDESKEAYEKYRKDLNEDDDDTEEEVIETETTETSEDGRPVYGSEEAVELYSEHSYMSNPGDGGIGKLPQRVIDERYISLPAGSERSTDWFGNSVTFKDANGTVLIEYRLPDGSLVWVNRR